MSLKLSERPCFRCTSSTYSTSLQVQDFLLTFNDRDTVDFLLRRPNMQLAAIYHMKTSTYATLPAYIVLAVSHPPQHQHYPPVSARISTPAPVTYTIVNLLSASASSSRPRRLDTSTIPSYRVDIALEPAICITPNHFNTSRWHGITTQAGRHQSFVCTPASTSSRANQSR